FMAYDITKGKGGFEVENVWTPRYHVAFSDPEAPFAYTDLRIAKGDDGRSWGPDFLDTFRFLISIDTLLVNFIFKTENLLPERMGYIEGPLRVTRRIHLKIKFLGLVIPEFLVKAFSDIELDTDSFYYPMHFYFAASLGIPEFVVRRAEDSYGVFTTDFSERAAGGLWANSRNAGGGIVVDGRMEEAEKKLDAGLAAWMLMAGPAGGWLNVVHVGEGFADVGKKLYYSDNALETPTEEEEDLPEFKRAYGSSGYRFDDFSKIRIGAPLNFETYIFALPPGFRENDVPTYTRMLTAPVAVSLGETRRKAAPEGAPPEVGL
ncbi:MAG: hypothetical protein K8I02_06040, partial [Candidatus Methylomirabilis sp.]|nr:hypothetical protein [Deltaproteobacteria bacterium]